MLPVHCQLNAPRPDRQSNLALPCRGLCLRLSLALDFVHEVSFCVCPVLSLSAPSARGVRIRIHLCDPLTPILLLRATSSGQCILPHSPSASLSMALGHLLQLKCARKMFFESPRSSSCALHPPPRPPAESWMCFTCESIRFDSNRALRMPTSKTNCCILMCRPR